MNILLLNLSLFIIVIIIWALWSKNDIPKNNINNEFPDERLTRRATDKEIEERYPNLTEKHYRRKNDIPENKIAEKIEEVFNIPFSGKEIIPESSRFKIYLRALHNSEIYARKGDFISAISLYEGVNKRINDEEVNNKILENINYILEYKNFIEKKRELKKKEGMKRLKEETQEESNKNDINVSIDGPMSIPEKIQIGFTNPHLEDEFYSNKIAEEITRKLTDQGIIKSNDETELKKYNSKIEQLENNIDKLLDFKDNIQETSDDLETQKLREGELKKYNSKIEHLENSINKVLDLKNNIQKTSDDLETQKSLEKEKELSSLKESINSLNDKVSDLTRDKEKTQKELEEIKSKKDRYENKEGEVKSLEVRIADKDINQMSELKKELNQINEELKGITNNLKVKETDKEPTLTEVKYDSPIPDISNSQLLDQIKNSIPVQYPPEPKEIKFPEDGREEHNKLNKGSSGRKPQKTKLTKEEKKEEEFKLLRDYDDYDDDTDEISDDDIFEKILESAQNNKKEPIEIIGDTKELNKSINDIIDKDTEREQKEEEIFYEKFLNHDKRKKKELPILKVSYDFSKLPDEFNLSKEKNLLEYSFYKYKPMLEKAADFIKNRRVKDAINYYKVVMSQNVPPEFKVMVRKNIRDLTDYLEKFLSAD